MMMAVTQDRYGDAEVLRFTQIRRPTITAREVLVRVRAAGVDRGTEHVMTGRPLASRLAFGVRRPRNPVPGRDVAGTVTAVGAAVTRFTVGDEVYGVAPGSFAELAVAPADKLARKPANLSFAQAAVVPISGGTALQALCDAGRLKSGQSVLILGASGGVGTFAVQLAKAFGAEVTGTCSASKRDLVGSLGADYVLDYAQDDFADGRRGYDLILDIGGNSSLRRLRRALEPGGTVVFVGGENAGNLTGMGRQLRGAMLGLATRERLALFLARERATDFERLTELIEAGKVTPCLDRTYQLDQAADALRQLGAGTVRGKLAVVV